MAIINGIASEFTMSAINDESKLAYANGRIRGMIDVLHMLYPKGIQNTDAIEELVSMLKEMEKETDDE